MHLYCSCGGKTEYSGVKPNFCSFCSEPFVKKVAAAVPVAPTPVSRPVVKTVPGRKSIAERIQEMEEAMEDIPTSFEITAEAEMIEVATQSRDPNRIETVGRKLDKRYR